MRGEDVGASKDGNWALNYYNQGIEQKLYTQMDIKESMLADPIRRKHMALIVSKASPGKVIEDYDIIKNSIQDLNQGKDYEHAIVKAYDLGILYRWYL